MNTLEKLAVSIVAVAALSASYSAVGDSRPLATPSYEAAGARAADQSDFDNVRRAIAAHLELWTSADPVHYPYETLLADDVVYEFPYADTPSSTRIEGKKAIADYLRGLAEPTTQWTFSDLRFFRTLEPDVFFVSLTGEAVVRDTGRPYRQTFLIRVTLDGDKISNLYLLWDQKAHATAFGRAN
jgi:uncharacterized protein